MKLKLKLNFKIDEPTENGRIYSKEVLKNSIDERLKENKLFVTKECPKDFVVYSKEIIGIVKSYEILEDNSVVFEVKSTSSFLSEEFKNNVELTTYGFCDTVLENVYVKDIKLISLFLVNKKGN